MVTGVLGHPLGPAGADRLKVSGSGVREMPHARSSVTWHRPPWMTVAGFERPAQRLVDKCSSFMLSVGPPSMRTACD